MWCNNIFHVEHEPEISNKIVLTDEKDEFENNKAMLIYKKSKLVRKTASNV